ncbi:MAG: hypothetical protein COV30_00550 [Candidatus Yanofskybacteria bacterium CG10_big_fil_rev_8_21_14_0_10_37_15]|uniref:Uncharacterized protein n=1 Tax=Candidatus Yanofskybacteria bacterium CG10_big_fil_rev_8_21_14_0_10_37_15 TaxID=1975097 RepID=A0A2H0R697_9BACT|nr:MAG: hypothetical protein COV30_00550 [Candidatus Yanofskybacteria bacterium CG10_big_fil_rev_8_21_14_0_10_37_15]
MLKETPPSPTTANHDWLSEAEKKTFELLKTEYEKTAINMTKFVKVAGYGKERVERDQEMVRKKKKEIQEAGTGPTRKARLLEALLTEQIELSNWFGENTYTIIPAEFDDLFHGVDLALEIEDENEVKHIALGIDVTSSSVSIRKKLKIIKDHIADGTLTSMEYFHSEDHNPDFYGTMSNIPQVVIGSDGKTIKELSELWMSAYGLAKLRKDSKQTPLSPETKEGQKKSSRKAREELARHRVQALILEEIKMQLTVFSRFATEKKQYGTAKKLTSSLDLINSILSSKENPSINDVFQNREDFVFQALTETLNDFDNL